MPSTVIASMYYDVELHSLKIIFVSGLIYEYKNVPEDIYNQLKTSGSKGTYFNRHIKGNYQFEKVN
jgi:KTSC domain-containing protein